MQSCFDVVIEREYRGMILGLGDVVIPGESGSPLFPIRLFQAISSPSVSAWISPREERVSSTGQFPWPVLPSLIILSPLFEDTVSV